MPKTKWKIKLCAAATEFILSNQRWHQRVHLDNPSRTKHSIAVFEWMTPEIHSGSRSNVEFMFVLSLDSLNQIPRCDISFDSACQGEDIGSIVGSIGWTRSKGNLWLGRSSAYVGLAISWNGYMHWLESVAIWCKVKRANSSWFSFRRIHDYIVLCMPAIPEIHKTIFGHTSNTDKIEPRWGET